MSNKITQEARAKEAPNAITEKRLQDESLPYHPRTEKVDESVEGKQLAEQHSAKEPNSIEEVILEDAREDSTPSSVEEKNLEDGRKGDVKPETMQAKLESQRVGKEPNMTLQGLLSNPRVDTPSTRSSSSIKDHVEAAVRVIAKTVISAQSTPDRVVKFAGSFGSLSLNEQSSLVKSLSSFKGETPVFEDVVKRASFWSNKGLQVVAASDKEIKDLLISIAGSEVASNNLNPELIIKSFTVLKNNKLASEIVAKKVQEIMDSGSMNDSKSAEEEIESQLSEMLPKEEKVVASNLEEVKSETKALSSALKEATKDDAGIIIETSFKEMGVKKEFQNDDNIVGVMAEAFARGACAKHGIKMAAVVNVTIDGESGDVVIAVDTEEGSVEIPVGDSGKDEVPELDMESPTLPEDTLNSEDSSASSSLPPPPPAAPATGTPPVQKSVGMPGIQGMPEQLRASSKSMKKSAQFGGGAPASPGPDPNSAGKPMDPTLDTTSPSDAGAGEGLESFTTEEGAGEELPGDVEQKTAGSICPFCASSETETGRKDQSSGQYDCKSCGMKYSFTVNVEILNPENIIKTSEGDLDKELENPKAPAMPVAAEAELNRDCIKKLAKTQSDIGYVCPGCGSKEVKTSGNISDMKIKCDSCHTDSERSVLINVEDPTESIVRVAWTLDPMKRKCSSCHTSAKKFASEVVFSKMMKRAASISDFPEEKVRYWLENNYPDTNVVNNGPYKGENFADTIVSQLKRFGFSKTKYLKRLAEVQAQEDPMDTCVKDHKRKGYAIAEANKICGCLKDKYASENDENIYIQAYANMIDVNILRKMASFDNNMSKKSETSIGINDEESLDKLPVRPRNSKVTAKDISNSLKKEMKEIEVTLFEEEVKTASKNEVTKVEYVSDKEKDVKADGIVNKDNHMTDCPCTKANPSRGSIGEEPTDKIPGPKVPRGDATMGKEVKPPSEGVSVPSKEKDINTSALGQSESSTEGDKMNKQAYAEKETMKRVENPKVENADKTTGDTALEQKNNSEKKVQVVESIEEKDDVARGKATINQEKAFDAKDPDIPRSKATMGNENPPKAQEVSIPSEVADTQVTMRGREAERQTQLDKIASVRRERAMRYAGQLLERGMIEEANLDDFVKDLSLLPLDRMNEHVAMMLKNQTKKVASTAPETLSTPIIKESETKVIDSEEKSLSEKLSSMFTIGGRQQDRVIREDLKTRESF